jgi:protein phosphatase
MDKIAIISDIHGNLVALEEVIKDIKSQGIEHIFCLGDLVAKGSHPKECIELIKKECEVVIKGNCDDVVSCNYSTKEHIWNKEKIGDENVNYLKNLPFSYDFYMSGLKIRIIHASPKSMYESIDYYNIDESLNEELKKMFEFEEDKPDVVIFGHIHSPILYKVESNTLVNPGAVSNGCDIINKENQKVELSSYMIIEGEYNSKKISSIAYEIVKLPFDYLKEIENLKVSDMPNKEMAIEEIETGIYVKR